MGYLILEILFFLALACGLGIIIGWFLRGSRFESQIQDLDARWRTKLSEIESERDRFATEINQANDARTRSEASAADARRLAETHEASLRELRQEHETKLGLLSDVEGRAGGLEKELADAKASLANLESTGGDATRVNKDIAAANARAEALRNDLTAAKEANNDCRRNVERLEAELANLRQSSGVGEGAGGALGLTGPRGAATSSGTTEPSATGSGSPLGFTAAGGAATTAGSAGRGSSASASTEGAGGSSSDSDGSAAGSNNAPLGLVGGTDTTQGSGSSGGSSGVSGGGREPSYAQRAAAPSGLTEAGRQDFTSAAGGGASTAGAAEEEHEGVRPDSLTGPHGGVPDDLKKISGVGPKLEKTLHGLGIFHFSQIAEFTRDNVAWVDRHLRFKGRIDRENWIEQAKILAAGGETEFSKRKK